MARTLDEQLLDALNAAADCQAGGSLPGGERRFPSLDGTVWGPQMKPLVELSEREKLQHLGALLETIHRGGAASALIGEGIQALLDSKAR